MRSLSVQSCISKEHLPVAGVEVACRCDGIPRHDGHVTRHLSGTGIYRVALWRSQPDRCGCRPNSSRDRPVQRELSPRQTNKVAVTCCSCTATKPLEACGSPSRRPLAGAVALLWASSQTALHGARPPVVSSQPATVCQDICGRLHCPDMVPGGLLKTHAPPKRLRAQPRREQVQRLQSRVAAAGGNLQARAAVRRFHCILPRTTEGSVGHERAAFSQQRAVEAARAGIAARVRLALVHGRGPSGSTGTHGRRQDSQWRVGGLGHDSGPGS